MSGHIPEQGVNLADLLRSELNALHSLIGEDAPCVLTPRGSLDSRNVRGGTAH